MAWEVRVVLDTAEDKRKVEVEAKKLGVSGAGLFRLLFKNWVGEVKIERTEEKQDGSTNNTK
jgi:hypothetical protein